MAELRSLILVAVAAAVAHCSSAPESPSGPDTPLPLIRLRSEPLSYAYATNLRAPSRTVVRDRAAWQALWATMWREDSPPPPLPDIEFDKEMVIVAALGEQPTGGHSIFIDAASESAGGITVNIRAVSPGPDCGTTQALTQPVDVGRLPRRDRPVTFADRREVQECP